MNYKAFTQEKMVVTLSDYIRMVVQFTKKIKVRTESRVFRKRFFVAENFEIDMRKLYDKNSDTYTICLDEIGTNKIFIEKISNRDGVYYKMREAITKEQYLMIADGEIEWLKEHSTPLLKELYWEMQLNQLQLSTVYEFTREIIELEHSEIIFDKEIRHLGDDLLMSDEGMTDDREIDKSTDIFVTYRKEVGVPQFFGELFRNNRLEQPALQLN